jgi:hypothetical protein
METEMDNLATIPGPCCWQRQERPPWNLEESMDL